MPHASIHQNMTLTEELFSRLVDRIFILGMQSVSRDSMTEMGTTWGLSNKYFWSPTYLVMVSTECQWPRLRLKSQDNIITQRNWSAAGCKLATLYCFHHESGCNLFSSVAIGTRSAYEFAFAACNASAKMPVHERPNNMAYLLPQCLTQHCF